MQDSFSSSADSVLAPSRHVTTLTPSDSADLVNLPKAIYVGTGGDLALIGADAPATATGITFKNLPSGALLPIRARRVLATGTTAGNLLAVL